MELSFIHPAFALLLLGLPLVWVFPARSRPLLHKVIRTAVLAAVIIALTQPVMTTSSTKEHHVIILDRSPSVSPAARRDGEAAALRLAQAADEEDAVTVITIGEEAEEPPLDGDIVVLGGQSSTSSLGTALELAAQSIPFGVGGSVTLISDGLATDRHWGRAVRQLTERNIPVHSFHVAAGSADVFPVAIEAAPARIGESVRVAVDVVGAGDGLAVTLRSGGETLVASEPFASGGRHRVALEFEAEAPGFLELTAEVTAPAAYDGTPGNNALRTVVPIQDPVRLLYLTGRQQGGGSRLSGLLGAGLDVTEAAPETLSISPDFSRFDAVMLDDIAAAAVPAEVQDDIASAVRHDGLGLIHSGGEAAFGAGGYHNSAFADVLPVDINQEEDKSDPSVALAIIIDTSGSMAGTRIELARQIARIAVRRLQPHDRIGIVEFYGAKHWAIPMQPASNKIEIERAIGRMKAIGGTVLYPAIQEAYYGIKNVNTRYRHILVITDAGVEDQDYESMVRRISKDGINLSTILVGQSGHNLVMSDMANWGKGRFYAVADHFSLVELILKQPSTKKLPAYKRGIFEAQALGGPGWWGAVNTEELPNLGGYVEVRARDDSEVLLEEKQSGHPLLSTWRFGQGRVTALMTEPLGNGTTGWQAWRDYGEWLGRIVARTASDQVPFDLAAKRRGDEVTLTALRLKRDPGLTPTAFRVDAAGARLGEEPIAFAERAPGLFEAIIGVEPDDDARFVVEAGAAGLQRIADAARSDVAPETQVDPDKALDLGLLSARTGGTAFGGLQSADWALDAGSGEFSLIVVKLWPFLLLFALLAYLAELLYRRWPGGARPAAEPA